MFEIIIILLIIVCGLVGYNIYINTRSSIDEANEGDEILNEISTSLDEQKTNLQNQKEDIAKLSMGISEFNYPLRALTRYLSGGPLAGRFGEWGLEAIINDIIPNYKFKKNHEVKEGSGQRVEFVIKLDEGLLPIDAKFPSALYDTYIRASEKHDDNAKKEVESSIKDIRRATKKNAKDINEKYLQKGITIDFGIMFIPSESLMQLIESIKEDNIDRSIKEQIFRDYRVLVMGPNSFAAFLMTINMGFKSIALNERAEEILKRFGKLEKEFRLFEGMTADLRDKAQKILKAIDSGETRVRAMNRVIKEMEELTEDKKDDD